jgi:hypothetical protein
MTDKPSDSDNQVPSTEWMRRYDTVRRLSKSQGRLPTRSSSPDLALVAWISNQRRAWNLTLEQQRLLSELPGWSWAPHQDRWEQRAEELRLFIATHGRAPRARAAHLDERSLAHWYSRQRIAVQRGDLNQERTAALAYAIRGLTAN